MSELLSQKSNVKDMSYAKWKTWSKGKMKQKQQEKSWNTIHGIDKKL